MDVEVAPLLRSGRKSLFDGPPALLQEAATNGMPWQSRTRLVIHAQEQTLVASILVTAVAELGLTELVPNSSEIPGNLFLGLYFAGEDDTPTRIETLLDKEGVAYWYFSSEQIAMADVVNLSAEGLLLAEPARIYLLLDAPESAGGNGLDYWLETLRTLQQCLPYIQSAVDAGSTTYAAYSALRYAIRQVESHRLSWTRRGADLKKFQSLFKTGRTTAQAAALLSIDEEATPSFLRFLGLGEDKQGYWRALIDPSSRDLLELVDVVDAVAHYSLPGPVRDQALQTILLQEPGKRLSNLHGILNSSYLRVSSIEEPSSYFIEPIDPAGGFLVRGFRGRTAYIAGRILPTEDNGYECILANGQPISNSSGELERFDSLDAASMRLWTASSSQPPGR